MMKYKYLYLIFIIVLSCKSDNFLKVEKRTPDGTLVYTCIIDTTNNKNDTIEKIEFYPNGKIRVKGTYKNNLREGLWEYYHENGKLWSTGNFVNGKSNGVFTIYNKDGSLFMKSSYKNGKPDGKWSFYENNKLKKEVYFSNDSIVKEINY